VKGVAVLSFDQFREFRSSGLVPQFSVDGQQIPAYAFAGGKRRFGAGKEWKLFPQYIGKADLLYLYRRCDIAANAVDIPPRDVWSKGFTIKVIDPAGNEVKDSPLAKKIWQINQDHRVRAVFEEAHRYARLFGLGIVVIGLQDGRKLEDPVDRAQDLAYLRAFSSYEVTEITFDKDPASDRFGEIEKYKVTIGGAGAGASQQLDFWVHADRVIHVMEKTLEKDPWGVSVLEPCYDLFQVLKNTDWSAGEAYYQNASPLFILSYEVDDLAEPPTDAEIDSAKEDLEDIHVRKRFIKPATWHLETVKGSGQLPDPGNVWGPVVERIAGGVKIPKQILLGTSAGALASGQVNLQQYYKDIAGTQSNFAEPLLVDFYSRLQKWGILPEGDFDIEWTPLWETSEQERSQINYTKMRTAAAALGDSMRGVPPLMSVEEVREQILGLNPQIGGGRLPTLKTEASKQTEHIQVLDFSVEALAKGFNRLVEQAVDGKPLERVVEEAELLIGHHVAMARENARRVLERRLGRSIPNLSEEDEARFRELEERYLQDFKQILYDALKAAGT